MRTLQDVMQRFPGSAQTGLSAEAVARSAREFGANSLTPLPQEPLWKKFLGKFDEPIIKVLLAAALLSMFVGLFQVEAVLAGVALGVLAGAVIAALVLHKGHWVPALLFVAALLVLAAGLIADWRHAEKLVEGVAVMLAVILATGVAFLSEYKSDREFEKLNAHKEALRVKVLRDGAVHTVSLEQVVVGDAVELETGDEIPGDGRLIKATDLYVDQALMTGESMPVRKASQSPEFAADGPDQPGCLYRGTQVVDGAGRMIVTEVGDATYLGQIARNLTADEDEDEEEAVAPDTAERRVQRKLTISKELTPLQQKLTKLADLISRIGYIAAGLIFVALLVRGMFFANPPEVFWPQSGADALKVAQSFLAYFVYMVIIIVVAVPEGLPMSVTVSLALAMQKMTRANSLVRQLVACETIGSATVICSDKTGTLTQNKMQVVRLFWDGVTRDRSSMEWVWPDAAALHSFPPPPAGGGQGGGGKPLDWIVLNAAADSTANLEDKNGKAVIVGNPTEGALLQWLAEAGLDYHKLRGQFSPLYQILFSSERKRMTTVVRIGDRIVVLAKGSPEWLLENSAQYQAADGVARDWSAESREAVRTALHDSSLQAMRTLGFGHAALPADFPTNADEIQSRREALEKGLVFDGFIAIRDPLRPDVKEAVAKCRAAGIDVKMITGDNAETARAVAFDVGLIDRRDAAIDEPGAALLTSPIFNQWHADMEERIKRNDGAGAEELAGRLAAMRVLARAKPLDKYKMVELLQSRGQVVAVTGDGTNDAPALKKADVGLAMGITGTEVAKEASKIVLLDDSFSTIVKAVQWGRSLYENIQRFIQFQLTINVSALTIAFLGPFFGVRPPFTVLQLLWINVIMDTFASIALCSEPPREGVMRLPPKRRDENILTKPMLATIFGTAAFFVVVMLVLLIGMENFRWFAGGSGPNPEGWELSPLNIRQVSIFFTVYVFFQVWNQINARSLTPDMSGFSGLFKNRAFLAIAGTTALVQVLIISVPFVGVVFSVEPLRFLDWICILAGTASVLVFGEALRRVRLAMKPANV